MKPRDLFKILALWVCLWSSAAPSNATAETLDAVKWWSTTPGPYFFSRSALLSHLNTYVCINGRFGCSSEYTDQGYNPYYGQWGWGAVTTYSQVNSDGTIGTYSDKNTGWIFFSCPVGFSTTVNSQSPRATCSRPEPIAAPCHLCGPAAAKVGNPIFLGGGIKEQVEVDYENASGTLRFVRTYKSDQLRWDHNFSSFAADMNRSSYKLVAPSGCLWRKTYGAGGAWRCFNYFARGQTNDVQLRRANGRLLTFGTSTDLSPAKDVNDRVTPLVDSSGERVGLQVKNGDTDAIETYDMKGRLVSSTTRTGLTTTFSYFTPEPVPPSPDTFEPEVESPIDLREGRLLTVTDPYGQKLQFAYDDQNRMISMTDPAGGLYLYGYNPEGALISVTYPDGKSRRYIYGEPDKSSGELNPHLLTGILDENNVRFSSYAYDKNYRAISTEHAGGVEKYVTTYLDGAASQASVIDPLGTKRTHYSSNRFNVYRAWYAAQPDLIRGGTNVNTSYIGYDANGNVNSVQDFDGATTTYTFDLARNLETQRVEASGTATARTTSTQWHPIFRLPTKVAESKRITTYTHDDFGNVLTRTVQATTDANGASGFSATLTGTPQVWTYTYDAFGHVLTSQGPRTDVNATSTFTYDAEGNLATQTNAAGHVTTYTNYDQHGRVGRITDPNGLITDLSYKPRGWLASITVGGETTTYDYDGVGQVTQTTFPDGSAIYYVYDEAHRLTSIRDTLGNSITYTLDSMSNRTAEQTKDASGTLTRQITRAYDALNRVKQITGALQ